MRPGITGSIIRAVTGGKLEGVADVLGQTAGGILVNLAIGIIRISRILFRHRLGSTINRHGD